MEASLVHQGLEGHGHGSDSCIKTEKQNAGVSKKSVVKQRQ